MAELAGKYEEIFMHHDKDGNGYLDKIEIAKVSLQLMPRLS